MPSGVERTSLARQGSAAPINIVGKIRSAAQ